MRMPERSQILESVDRFERRDPELHRELRRKAAEPADDDRVFPIARKAAEILEEFEPTPEPTEDPRYRGAGPWTGPVATAAVEEVAPPRSASFDTEVTAYERRVAETIVRPSARPVLAIRDNKVTTDFLGPDSATWAARLDAASAMLNAVIPAIGRVELKNNADFSWVGTGWLVADDIIVTNRHVAREFGRCDDGGLRLPHRHQRGPRSRRSSTFSKSSTAARAWSSRSSRSSGSPRRTSRTSRTCASSGRRRDVGWRRRSRSPRRRRPTTSSSRLATPPGIRACRTSDWFSVSSGTSTRRSALRPAR